MFYEPKFNHFLFISSNCFLGTFHNFIFRLKRHDQSNWHSKQKSKQISIFIFSIANFLDQNFCTLDFLWINLFYMVFIFVTTHSQIIFLFFILNHYIFFTNNNSQYYLLPIIIQINRVFFLQMIQIKHPFIRTSTKFPNIKREFILLFGLYFFLNSV